MKLFKEIKRRAHNVVLAIAGKGPEWQEKLEPVKITINPGHVETFAAERVIVNIAEKWAKSETVKACYRRGLAAEIGYKLLDAGVIVEEITQRPNEMGRHDFTLRLSVRVVVPKEGAV